jgi:isochorismate hydrolase
MRIEPQRNRHWYGCGSLAKLEIMNRNHQETPRTIERLALTQRYRRHIESVPAAQTALLIIDMQNQFHGLWDGLENQQDLHAFTDLIHTARDTGCFILLTQHGHRNPEQDGGVLHQWWSSSICIGTREHEFIDGFVPLETDTVLPKTRYSAFHGTDLERLLRSKSIDRVIIGGVMTNLCCETTARDAFCRDFSVVFLADGTATVTETMHRSSLLNLGFGCAHILSCKQTAILLADQPIQSESTDCNDQSR